MSYGMPQPGDDAQLRAWRRRYAEDTERSFSLRLPLALARRLRAEATARGVPHSRYVADLLRAATGDLPGGPPRAPASPPAAAARGRVDLHDLRIVRLREGRAGDPRPLDTADRETVLRILRADLAWLEKGSDA